MRRLPRADARRHPLPADRHGGRLRHVPQPRLRPARRHHPHPAPRLARAGDRRSPRALPRRRPAAAGRARRRRARRPGDVAQIRAAVQFARARASLGGARRSGDPRASSRRAAPASIATRWSSRRPARSTIGIRPVAFPTRYMLHGWFDHRAHQIVQRPGQPRLDGAAACAAATARRRLEQRRPTCCCPISPAAAPAMAANARAGRSPRPARCATITIWTEARRPMLLRQRVRGRRWETTVIPVAGPRPRRRRGAERCWSRRSPTSISASSRAIRTSSTASGSTGRCAAWPR